MWSGLSNTDILFVCDVSMAKSRSVFKAILWKYDHSRILNGTPRCWEVCTSLYLIFRVACPMYQFRGTFSYAYIKHCGTSSLNLHWSIQNLSGNRDCVANERSLIEWWRGALYICHNFGFRVHLRGKRQVRMLFERSPSSNYFLSHV